MTPEQQARVQALRESEAYRNPLHPQHAATVAELEAVYKAAHPSESAGFGPPRAVAYRVPIKGDVR